MVFLHFALVASLVVLSSLGSARAASFAERLTGLSLPARDVLKRATPAAPRFVVYSDEYVSARPTAANIDGFNVFALSFLLVTGAADQALEWQELTADERANILREYNAAGISLMVSLFGSTDTPTTSGYDATTTANAMAAWALQYGVLGVDIDYEDFAAFDSGLAEKWLITLTTELRKQLPQGQYILTHAPVAPWFSPQTWARGGYLLINNAVGPLIDWYNIQFYNQGTTEYTTCEGLLYQSSATFPKSSLFQIAASGIPLDKLVIGKPALTRDASNGYMNPTLLASCVSEAHSAGWNAGVMVWEYPDAASAWITAVRGNTWPVTPQQAQQGTTATLTATGAASTSAAPSPTGTSSCANIPGWRSDIAYKGGSKVAFNGNRWVASYWNEDSAPGGAAGVWVAEGACI